MPAEQSIQTPTLRTIVALGASLYTLAINCNGFHHRSTIVKRMRSVVGSHRPITKIAHFVPLKEKRAADLTAIFAREIWKHQGIPTDIVSDCDSRFTSETWKEFLGLLRIHPRMSMAFHPQTDGQTEQLNQTIEAYLRAFVSKGQDNWASLLPMAEFA